MVDNSFKIASIMFMSVLLVWAVVWIILSIAKIRLNSEQKIFWQTHLFWNIVNLIIAVFSLISTLNNDVYSKQDAERLIEIVTINIGLDFVYLLIAFFLNKSKQLKKQLIAKALFIQGTFLLILDIVIVATLKSLL